MQANLPNIKPVPAFVEGTNHGTPGANAMAQQWGRVPQRAFGRALLPDAQAIYLQPERKLCTPANHK